MLNKKTMLLGAAGAAALALGGTALAFHPGGGGHGPMKMFDADGNGALSLAEVRQGAAAMFGKADTNGDGRVTADEMRAHHEAMMAEHRGGRGKGHKGEGHGPRGGKLHMDSDGDGAVTLAELQSKLEGHFTRADADKDGSVTRAEMEAAHGRGHGPGHD